MTKDYAIGLLTGILEGTTAIIDQSSYSERAAMKLKIRAALDRVNKELKDEPK